MPLVGVSTPLFDIHFSSNGWSWLVGGAGTLLHSTDGWVTWGHQTPCRPQGAAVFDLLAVAADAGGRNAWVVGTR